MSLSGDTVLALRRLRRHLTFWRLTAVAAVAAVVILLVGEQGILPHKDHVARIRVSGIIVEDGRVDDMLAELAEDTSAKAVIVEIDSPGGTFVGGESMYDGLRRIAETKPVVALMGGMATSGAYMTAIAADRIFARHGTVTGSIGVIMQTADVTGLLDKLGIKPETVKSGPLKAQPNPMEPFGDKARAATQAVIDELHGRFVEMVASRRGIGAAKVKGELADGRIFTGDAALTAGLVDAIGDGRAVRAWLEKEKGVSAALPLMDWEPKERFPWLRDGAEALLGKALFSERLRLDGIAAVWHPSLMTGR